MDSKRTGPHTAPTGAAGEIAMSSEEREAVNRLARDFREDPEAWLPDPADDATWERLAEEVWTAAEKAGLDPAAMSRAAETRALEDIVWLESPRASRTGLGEYLKRCREACGLSREQLAAQIALFASQEIAFIEDGKAPIYPLVEHRERGIADWARIVAASVRRIARLVRNCPQPPDWQTVPQVFVVTYGPASANEAVEADEPYLPPRAQAVINRLEAAAEETQGESSQV